MDKYLVTSFVPPYFKESYHACCYDIFISHIILQPLEMLENQKKSLACMVLFYGTDCYRDKPNSFLFETFYGSMDEAYEDMLNDFNVCPEDFRILTEEEKFKFEYIK